MKGTESVPLLRLALCALERPVPNIHLAVGLLRDLVGAVDEAPPPEPNDGQRAVSIGLAAARLGYSTKHVRALIKRGELPTIGAGRACRVLIGEALETLRANGKATSERVVEDDVAAAGAAWARRRSKLRAIDGGK